MATTIGRGGGDLGRVGGLRVHDDRTAQHRGGNRSGLNCHTSLISDHLEVLVEVTGADLADDMPVSGSIAMCSSTLVR
jgi:hypothetical protein